LSAQWSKAKEKTLTEGGNFSTLCGKCGLVSKKCCSSSKVISRGGFASPKKNLDGGQQFFNIVRQMPPRLKKVPLIVKGHFAWWFCLAKEVSLTEGGNFSTLCGKCRLASKKCRSSSNVIWRGGFASPKKYL